MAMYEDLVKTANQKLVEKLKNYSSDFGDLREEPSWVSEIKIRYDL